MSDIRQLVNFDSDSGLVTIDSDHWESHLTRFGNTVISSPAAVDEIFFGYNPQINNHSFVVTLVSANHGCRTIKAHRSSESLTDQQVSYILNWMLYDITIDIWPIWDRE